MPKLPNKKFFKLAGVAAAISLLSACGGSDSTSNDIPNIMEELEDVLTDTYQGTFIDSAVAGINYECGDLTGVTDSEGKFNYQLGDTCTFKLGDFSLGSIANMTVASPIVSPFDVAEDAEQAIKIASLLQTIDADGNPENGIDVSTFDASVLTAALLTADEEAFYQAIFALTGLTAVTLADAQQHMQASLAESKGYHSAAIEQVINEIEAVSDIEQLDLQSFLASLHAILDAGDDSNNKDILSLKALISIFEILNDPRVQARINITSTANDYTEFLPQIIDASMNAAEVMLKGATGTTEDLSGLFFEMSTRLVAASDALAESFADANYVASYGEDFNLTASIANQIQVSALGTASILSYFSAYNYGTDEYYLPQEIEQQIEVIDVPYYSNTAGDGLYQATTVTAESEFTTAGIHPETQLLDTDFASLHTDEKYLTLAKTSLIKVIEVGKAIYLAENADASATEQQENIDRIDSVLNNLMAEEGEDSPIALGLFTDNTEGKLNLQAMYSVDTAIDRDDFDIDASINCGDYTYSEIFSKYMNQPMCSLGDYTDGEIVDFGNSTFIYGDGANIYTVIYAVSAEVDTSIEPKATADPERILLECTYTDETNLVQDCLD